MPVEAKPVLVPVSEPQYTEHGVVRDRKLSYTECCVLPGQMIKDLAEVCGEIPEILIQFGKQDVERLSGYLSGKFTSGILKLSSRSAKITRDNGDYSIYITPVVSEVERTYRDSSGSKCKKTMQIRTGVYGIQDSPGGIDYSHAASQSTQELDSTLLGVAETNGLMCDLRESKPIEPPKPGIRLLVKSVLRGHK